MKKFLVTVFLVSTLMFTGCAHVPAGTTTPPPAVSAFTKVLATNDALALSNDSIVDAVKLLNVNAVLSDSQTSLVLVTQKKIAQADLQLTTILDQGPVYAQANVGSITTLIGTIQSAGLALQAQGVIPNSPAEVQLATEINTVVTLATTITQELVIAGVK